MQCILIISIPHYYPTACLRTSQRIFLPTSSSLFMNACKQQGTALRFLRPKFLWMGRDQKSHSPWHCLPSVWMLQGCQSSFLRGCQWDSSLEMRLDSPSVLLWPYCTLASFLLFSWTATTKLLSYCNISCTKFSERVHTTYSSYIMKHSATQQKSRGCVFMTPAV